MHRDHCEWFGLVTGRCGDHAGVGVAGRGGPCVVSAAHRVRPEFHGALLDPDRGTRVRGLPGLHRLIDDITPVGSQHVTDDVAIEERDGSGRPAVRNGDVVAVFRGHPQHHVTEREIGEQGEIGCHEIEPLNLVLTEGRVLGREVAQRRHGSSVLRRRWIQSAPTLGVIAH